jgi:ribosomal protein S18 acetylase RimI-like enzyme
MTADDYEGVFELWNTVPGIGLRKEEDSEPGIRRFLERNPRTCFVAEEDGTIIGVLLSGHDGRRGFIYHTAVKADYQRRGIGRRLVSAAEDALKQEGIRKTALVVFEDNEAGNRFWEAAGFSVRPDLVYRNKAAALLT